MGAPEINGQSIPLPEGFRFGSMNVHTESWEAWDALTDGWTERTFEREGERPHVCKTLGPWPSGYVVAHAPHEPRPRPVGGPA